MAEEITDFQKIYEDFYPKILRYMTRMVGEGEAEDLTQEVFIKAGVALPSFRGDSSLSTWIYRIATHCAFDRLRSTSFRRMSSKKTYDDPFEEVVEEIGECDPWTGDKTPLAEQQFVKKEMSECILRFVDQLPESYRTVVLLSDLEELSNKEIAEIMGVSLETVKIRLHRARARLRDQFETHCEYYWVSELSWQAA
jgi:RNA polymerase sigma-70 factor (ECF subfamily)